MGAQIQSIRNEKKRSQTGAQADVGLEEVNERRQECLDSHSNAKGDSPLRGVGAGRAQSVESAVDPATGRTFYYNKHTGRSEWTAEEAVCFNVWVKNR